MSAFRPIVPKKDASVSSDPDDEAVPPVPSPVYSPNDGLLPGITRSDVLVDMLESVRATLEQVSELIADSPKAELLSDKDTVRSASGNVVYCAELLQRIGASLKLGDAANSD
ncbi:hypothetical protein DIPPA_03678 [Diplonema papillatum]|nr:hypothetical protein DIPPA_03678 [Diplonema papillatum]